MSNIEKYKKYFTKDYLMGPNSFRLLDELIRRSPENVRYTVCAVSQNTDSFSG